MAETNTEINAIVDPSGASHALADIVARERLNNIGTSLDNFNTAATDNKKRLDDLNTTVTDNKKRLDDLNTSVTDNKKRLDDLNTTVTDNKKRLDDLNTTVTDTNNTLTEVRSQVTDNQQAIAQLASASVGDIFEYLEEQYPDGGAGLHNSIFRGKNLGSAPTTEQYNNIKNGTFKGIWLGDYWSDGGNNYRNAGCDQFYNIGDSAYNTHNVMVLTDSNLLKANGTDTRYMQNDNTIPANGYIGTKMWTDTLPNSVLPVFQKVFGDHLFTHRELLCNAASDGKANGWAWTDVIVNIPNQVMVYSTQAWIQPDYASMGYQIGSRHQILPLFIARPDLVNNREAYWLSDITSSTNFAFVDYLGHASGDGAWTPWIGVRPYALIKG